MDTLRALGEIGLGSRLKRLSESLMKEIQGIYNSQNIDFDPYLFPAFHKIASAKKITNTELCDTLQTTQPAVTQTINKLIKKDLVVVSEDSTDKRRKQIAISKKGELLLNQLQPLWKIMDATIKEFSTSPTTSLIGQIEQFEQRLYSGEIMASIKEKIADQSKIKIIEFNEKYATDFYDLNIEWLETYFYVEPFDEEVLSKPGKYIIEPGGHIFFAVEKGKVLGTVALMPYSEKVFELTKMAVRPDQRGKKIGQKLMQHCIDFGRSHDYDKLLLYSNTKLENAIYIYRKYGFIEIPVEKDSPYVRSNIKMELPL